MATHRAHRALSVMFTWLLLSSCASEITTEASRTSTTSIAIPPTAPPIITELPGIGATTTASTPSPEATPTISTPRALQLTFTAFFPEDVEALGAIDVGCPRETPPCLDEPVTLFEARNPYSPVAIHEHAWSPDGRYVAIAMASNIDDSTDIFLGEATRDRIEGLRNLTQSAVVWESDVSWAPDGSRLVYSRSSSAQEGTRIFAIGLDGSAQGQFLSSSGFQSPSYVRLAPGGDRLAFLLPRGLDTLLYVSNLEGTSAVAITQTGHVDGAGSFSPDGRSLVYCWLTDLTSHAGQLVVVSFGLDGEPIRSAIVTEAEGCSEPSWSPDGEWIAFGGRIDGLWRVQIVRPDGSDRLTVETGAGDAGDPQWRSLLHES